MVSQWRGVDDDEDVVVVVTVVAAAVAVVVAAAVGPMVEREGEAAATPAVPVPEGPVPAICLLLDKTLNG